jgi:hypothetical protein
MPRRGRIKILGKRAGYDREADARALAELERKLRREQRLQRAADEQARKGQAERRGQRG